jgi:hypothetical protein
MHSLQTLQVYNILVVSVSKTGVKHKNRTVTSAQVSGIFFSQFKN